MSQTLETVYLLDSKQSQQIEKIAENCIQYI